MRLIVACKVVPDDQDISILPSRELDCTKAKPVISTYDLNAIEAAVQVPNATVSILCVGGEELDDTKLRKDILARGPEELYCVKAPSLVGADAHVTAQAIVAALPVMGEYDAVIFGAGSADNYAQQVNAQVAGMLKVPSIVGATSITAENGRFEITRTLEDSIEVLDVPMPCVIAVDPSIALPRVCTMKEILGAGKKPCTCLSLSDLSLVPVPALETSSILAPEPMPRRNEIHDISEDGALEGFIEALKANMR